jgi:hypothetical protein
MRVVKHNFLLSIALSAFFILPTVSESKSEPTATQPQKSELSPVQRYIIMERNPMQLNFLADLYDRMHILEEYAYDKANEAKKKNDQAGYQKFKALESEAIAEKKRIDEEGAKAAAELSKAAMTNVDWHARDLEIHSRVHSKDFMDAFNKRSEMESKLDQLKRDLEVAKKAKPSKENQSKIAYLKRSIDTVEQHHLKYLESALKESAESLRKTASKERFFVKSANLQGAQSAQNTSGMDLEEYTKSQQQSVQLSEKMARPNVKGKQQKIYN